VESASKGSSFEFAHAIEKGGRRTEKEAFGEKRAKALHKAIHKQLKSEGLV
jgi:hypothetical protein